MIDAISHKDVAITLLGAESALAGLLLVFLGLVVRAYQGFAGDAPPRVFNPYRTFTLSSLGRFIGLALRWPSNSSSPRNEGYDCEDYRDGDCGEDEAVPA